MERATGRHGAWHPARGGLHLAEWGAELVGTGLLLLGGISAIVLDFGPGSPVASVLPSISLRLLLTGALFAGCGGLVTISPIGRRSGAHLNPVVTAAFWLTGHVHPHDLVGYIVAQCLGAIAGTWLAAGIWAGSAAAVHDGLTQPGTGVGEPLAVALEAAMTAALVLTILVFVANARTMRWTPLAVWAVVTLLVWQGAMLTGTSLNPARSLGPAVVSGTFRALEVYALGPLLGALAAVALRRALLPEMVPMTAKLFHSAGDTGTSLGHFAGASARQPAEAR